MLVVHVVGAYGYNSLDCNIKPRFESNGWLVLMDIIP